MAESRKNAPALQTEASWQFMWRSMLAGAIAGGISKTVGAPFDRLKIIFQVNNRYYKRNGVWNTLFEVGQKEGFRGYFKGHFAMLARILPYAAIQFTVYDQLKKLLNVEQKRSSWRFLVCGAGAGIACTACTYPLDVIRTRLAFQVSQKYYLGILDAFRKILSEGGFRGFFVGLVPTLQGIIPYAGVSFMTYEFLKGRLRKFNNSNEIPYLQRVLAGAFAGMMAQTVSYPWDVVRRRMQLQGVVYHHEAKGTYLSTWQGMRLVVKNEGLYGLFRGISINYIRVFPVAGVSFATYEQMKKLLNLDVNI